MTLTINSRRAIGLLWLRTTHKQTLKFKGQSVQKIEWKQTNGQTDTTDCIAFPANATGKISAYQRSARNKLNIENSTINSFNSEIKFNTFPRCWINGRSNIKSFLLTCRLLSTHTLRDIAALCPLLSTFVDIRNQPLGCSTFIDSRAERVKFYSLSKHKLQQILTDKNPLASE